MLRSVRFFVHSSKYAIHTTWSSVIISSIPGGNLSHKRKSHVVSDVGHFVITKKAKEIAVEQCFVPQCFVPYSKYALISQLYSRKLLEISTVVPCCMLFQSLLHCSNSCTSLHFKTLKSHTKTRKIRSSMFRSHLKPSSVGPWPYFATLLNWNLLIYIRHNWCRFVAVCQFIPSVCVCVCIYIPIWYPLLLLFSRLYDVSTSSCARWTLIISSSSIRLCHSSLLPLVPFPPSVLESLPTKWV